jgi:hypothetical protein
MRYKHTHAYVRRRASERLPLPCPILFLHKTKSRTPSFNLSVCPGGDCLTYECLAAIKNQRAQKPLPHSVRELKPSLKLWRATKAFNIVIKYYDF